MPRTLLTWTVVPVAALAVLAAVYAGLGVIESITVAALATIAWSFVIRIVGSLAHEAGDSDGARD